jgi:hypothetical protein
MPESAKDFWDKHLANSKVPFGEVDKSRPKCKGCGIYYATPYDEDFLCHRCRDKKYKEEAC